MRTRIPLCLALILFSSSLALLRAETASEGSSTIEWPVVTSTTAGELSLYRPQIDTFSGNRITARATFSQRTSGKAEPSYGVVWLSARAITDRDARTITLSEQTATKVHQAESALEAQPALLAALTEMIKNLDPVMSLDQVLAEMDDSNLAAQSVDDLNSAPPNIMVVDHPAMLLTLDGKPLGEPLAGGNYERIQNTPFTLAREVKTDVFWLAYAGRWYRASGITGAWTVNDQVPAEVAALVPDAETPDDPPVAVFVSFEPTELITSDGPLTFAPIPGTTLTGATNSDSQLFADTTTKQHYLLIGGRWFRTANVVQGPWVSVNQGELPADFAHIPDDSKYAPILASVAGTPQAEDAVRDVMIPQTAEVRRDATTEVTYDGSPQWEPVGNTKLTYAVNSPQSVLKVSDNDFYVCEQGIWYHATSATGPWLVATSRPAEVTSIAPQHPLYHVRYVEVYDSTPNVVRVGYRAGYLGSYPWRGTVVWGTGYPYRGWRGQRHYYPRPVTWGFGMSYNAWTGGWGVGVRHGIGRRYDFDRDGRRYGGWWGPAGYRPVTVNTRVTVNIRPGASLIERQTENIYGRADNRERVFISSASKAPPRQQSTSAQSSEKSAQPRDKYIQTPAERIISGKDGEIYRRQGDGWQEWQKNGWQDVARKPSTPVQQSHETKQLEPNQKPPEKNDESRADTGNANSANADANRQQPNSDPQNDPKREPPLNKQPNEQQTPSRVEQLDRQQHNQDRGVQRAQQYQQYRTGPQNDRTSNSPNNDKRN